MPRHAFEIAHVPTRKAFQVFALLRELHRERAAERRPAFFRIRGGIFRIGAGWWPVMNARTEEQNALSFTHGFGDGVEIVHRISREVEGKESRDGFTAGGPGSSTQN